MMDCNVLKIFESTKSKSTYIVSGCNERAYIKATGEASTNAKVKAEIERIRKGGCDLDTALWTAKMLASTY
jgi:hypothetical protein